MTSNSFPTLLTDLTASLPPSILPFITLSYPVNSSLLSRLSLSPATQVYDKGPKDLYFVCFCAIAFTVAREVALRYFFAVFARWWTKGGVVLSEKVEGKAERRLRKKREHLVTRFAEEAWRFTYCTTVWGIGMVSLSKGLEDLELIKGSLSSSRSLTQHPQSSCGAAILSDTSRLSRKSTTSASWGGGSTKYTSRTQKNGGQIIGK